MIVQADVTGLELAGAAFLSHDDVLRHEMHSGVDVHNNNQTAFGLPDRLIAKTLVFRILYGGSAFGFINDSNFTRVSTSQKYWERAIDKFYTKYSGIKQWHVQIVQEVAKTSMLTAPSGRMFTWDLKKFGSFKIPEPEVKNYMVQGFGADLVSVLRCMVFSRWKRQNIRGELINTVHDSISADVPESEVSRVVELFNQCFIDLPENINKVFDCGWDLNVRCEILVGNNQKDLQEI